MLCKCYPESPECVPLRKVWRHAGTTTPNREGRWLSPSALLGHLIIKLDKGR